MDMSQLAIGFLAAAAVGGAAYALIYPYLSGEARAEQRQKAMIGTSRVAQRVAATAAASQTARREKITQSLKEIEARQREAEKLTLDKRLSQAGLNWDKKRYFMVSAMAGLILGGAAYVLSGEPLVGGAMLFVGALGLPRWILGFLRNRRIKAFVNELPNAMDVIVRGIRSGLPLGDCMRMIANDATDPVKTEFRVVMEAHAMGLPIGEAVGKMYERVPVPEANFFAIVISIQQKSGGNLSEVLANLSRVIRDRKKMKGKISAMSMEAKASAAIIGSLPIIVGFLVWTTSPDYIQLLWTTIHGRMWMGGGALMMVVGVLVMKKMISFDI
jgi:tight adherence protein B